MSSHSPLSKQSNGSQFAHSFQELHDILLNAPIGIFKSTPEGRFLSANPALARIYGFKHPEDLINTITDIGTQLYVHPGDRIEFKRCLEHYGEIINYEYRLRRRDGSSIWVSTNAQVVSDNNGDVISYQGFTTDISQRKQAEENLEQKIQQLEKTKYSLSMADHRRQVLMHCSRDGIVIIDQNHKVIEANQSFADMLGYSLPEVKGLNSWDYVVDMTKEEICKGFHDLSKIDSIFESKHKRKDGSIIDVEVSITGTCIAGQNVVIAICREISERKRVEQQLEQSKQYYLSVFETSGAAQVIIDGDTTIVLANSRFEELTGYSRAEIENKKSWMDFNHPDDIGWMQKYHRLRRQSPDSAPKNYEFRLIDRSHNVHHVFLCVDIIPGTSQSVASLIDITKRKQAEQDLAHSHDLMRYVIEHANASVAVHDKNFRYMYVSQSYLEEYQIHDKKVIGRHHYEVIPELPQKWRNAHQRALNGEIVKKDRDPFYRPDGSLEWTRWECRPWYEVDGSIGGFIVYTEIITDQVKYEQQLQYMSLHDQLTGLYNRAYLEAELDRLQRSRDYPITIVCMDLDGLKLVNDTLGHDQGDEHLRVCANILRKSFRASDILARVGGDEFVALLPKTDLEAGERIVSRIRSSVDSLNLEHRAKIPLGLSIGLACALEDEPDLNQVYRQADDLMYRDKLNRDINARSQIIKALMAALEEKDFVTSGHAHRLKELCVQLGQKINLASSQLSALNLLAQVHDLGKVGIPDHVLFKPGPLNEQEWEIMRQHPEKGYRIAQSTSDLAGIADLILRHHERWDGKGYPLGLAGEEIPIECRILAIVDSFDAMINDRPYRQAMSVEDALMEVKKCSGSQFDPYLVDRFLEIMS
ncbi:MAG: PAS domain S-box protein [Thermodesulfobacteriota bacterium]